MSKTIIECGVTEYAVVSPKDYEKVTFYLDDKCIVISFMDNRDNVLSQSEIEKEDAINLAKLILFEYEILEIFKKEKGL
jgi:hypothetical protein